MVYLPFRAPADINIQSDSNGYFVPRFYVPRNRTGNIQYIIARRRAATGVPAWLPVSIFYWNIYRNIPRRAAGRDRAVVARTAAPIRGCILGGGV